MKEITTTTIIIVIIIECANEAMHNTVFSHRLMTDCTASPQRVAAEPVCFLELGNSADLAKLANFAELAEVMEKRPNSQKKVQTHRRDQTPIKREAKCLEKRVPASQPTLSHKLSMTPMVWNISVGQLGLAAWLCSLPALVHLLVSGVRGN